MDSAFTYSLIGIAFGIYLCGVLYVSFDDASDTWWIPFVTAPALPFLWLYENCVSIVLVVFIPLIVVALPVLLVESLRWAGLL
jgi:hypothetical protein